MERQKQDVAKLAYSSDAARIRPDQRARYENYLGEILGALGPPLDRDGTRGTPARLRNLERHAVA
jgi:GTP cyclohydrolase I